MFGIRTARKEAPAPPPSLEVHLVRHGQAFADRGIDTHGPELTASGRRQARRVARRLARQRYTAIYCSDLTRARQTADEIALHHPDDLLTVTRDLREVSGYHSDVHMSRLRSKIDKGHATPLLHTVRGAGYMIRGEIYRGASGVAGEIGHVTIDSDGPACVCGNRGCLATFIGSEALIAQARTLRGDFPQSLLASDEITISEIESAALASDPLALHLTRRAARRLGIAIADVLNLLNPAAVILGGSLSTLGDSLIIPLRETVVRRTFANSVASVDIRTSELGPRAIAVGAATLVLDAALKDPRLFPEVTAA